MMNCFWLATIITICLLFLLGCSGMENYIVNVPVPTLAARKNVNCSRIDYPEFSVHVRLLNDIKTFEMWYIFILPVYIQTKDEQELSYNRDRPPYDPEKEFRVLLAFRPKAQNYTLDANKISLFVDDIPFPVAGIEGPIRYFPYKNFAFPREVKESHLKERANKGYIFSVIQKEGPRKNVADGHSEVALSQTDLWNCFELIFNRPTPSPKQKFKLKIDGLKKENTAIDMPVIEFRESTFSDCGSFL